MQVVREHITSAYEELLEETTSIQINGELSDAARGMIEHVAGSGVALSVKPNALGGNTVYATDPEGRIVYYYAHLDAYRPGLVEGATIARGDVLGTVGTTGNAPKDTPHLHFQVMSMPADGKYWDGDAINPYPLFLLLHAARP